MMFKRKVGSKYSAVKTVVDGHTFDSKVEAKRYEFLKEEQRLGRIKDLELQPRFVLMDGFKRKGKTHRKTEYVSDFKYLKGSDVVIEDTKGLLTDVYKLKIKLFLSQLSNDIVFKEVYWKDKQWVEVDR